MSILDYFTNLISPQTPPTSESVTKQEKETKELERQAELAETQARLRERANKAKKRIKDTRQGLNNKLIYIGIGIIIVVIFLASKGC